jgi:PAS domain-containing protein
MELHSLLLEMMVLLGAWLCLAVLQKDRSTPGRKTFTLATLAWMTWCFGDLAGARGWLAPATSLQVAHVGSLLLAPLWLGLSAQSARLEIARRVPWFPLPLLVPGLVIISMLFSPRWRGLFLIAGEDGTNLTGPLWTVMVLYGFGLTLAGCGILIAAAIRWNQPGEQARRLAIALGPLVTLVGSGLYFIGVWQPSADPTPLLLGATFVILHGGIFAGGLLQPLAISQHALIQQLPVAIVLTDRGGVVVDINRVAERRLGILATAAIGRNFDAVIDASGAGIDFEITPVMSGGSEAGQIVLLDPANRKPPTTRELLAAVEPDPVELTPPTTARAAGSARSRP